MRGCQKVNNTEEANTRASSTPSRHSTLLSTTTTLRYLSPPASKSCQDGLLLFTFSFFSIFSCFLDSSSHHFWQRFQHYSWPSHFPRLYFNTPKPRAALHPTPV
ncbi:hypothetical protein E2C01_006204 [Portunus trituberculatus]|uniref:Uncharacterized protein n=1 Tax=Portunus trituberculatus TaxID=210409 RepID=A0A5B7CVP0_PORTR|nr:hypothetical protein [Portunus trituberculatus]